LNDAKEIIIHFVRAGPPTGLRADEQSSAANQMATPRPDWRNRAANPIVKRAHSIEFYHRQKTKTIFPVKLRFSISCM